MQLSHFLLLFTTKKRATADSNLKDSLGNV